ncbi:MAG: carbohydrate-binding protein, partial [Armatimonadota bacterium]|nr:carbohydrate-binding protein [Armatimonadota bacterium]
IGGFRHDDMNVSPPEGMWTNPQMSNTDGLDYAEKAPAIIVRVGRGGRRQNGALSPDGALTWAPFRNEPAGIRGAGSIAISADGQAILWAPDGAAVSVSHDHGLTWTASAGLAGGRIAVVSDRVKADTFYARSGDRLFVSTDAGATFAPVGTLPGGARQLKATPDHAGDLWLTAGSNGVYHSTDGGAHFTQVGNVPDAQGFGFGKAAPGQTYPALYLTGQTRNGESGVFRSDDAGQTWHRLNDSMHQYGYSGQVVTGDMRIYGRVYMGSNGRGVLYGDPAPGVTVSGGR